MSQVPDLGSPCAAPEAPITLSPTRQRACLEAAWEIEALALLLPKIELTEHPVAALQLRGLAARVARLSGVVMSGLDDAAVADGELQLLLHLPSC